MVKVFGCRPRWAAGHDEGRRTETARARTRGAAVTVYGDLRIVVRACGWSGDCTLGLAGGSGRSGWPASGQLPRSRGGGEGDLVAVVTMAALVVDAGARAPAGQSGMASTMASGPLCRVMIPACW